MGYDITYVKILFLIIGLYYHTNSLCQTKVWSLNECISFSLKNNNTIKQSKIQWEVAKLQLLQSRFNIWPTVNFQSYIGTQFGKTINPITNSFTNIDLLSNGFQINGSVVIYDFGRERNLIKAQNYNVRSSLLDVKSTSYDITFNVITYYLQALINKQQIEIISTQLQFSKKEYELIKKKVDKGALSSIHLAQIKTQLTQDSSDFIDAKNAFEVSLLGLKNTMNLDISAPLDLDLKSLSEFKMETLGNVEPNLIYMNSIHSQPKLLSDQLKVKQLEEVMKSNRKALFPYLSLNYNLGSVFSNYFTLKSFKNIWSNYNRQLSSNCFKVKL